MDADTKKKLRTRMRRIAGQVGAIERMIDEDTYCVDMLMQIAAVQGALGKVGEQVLEEHIHSCVADAFDSGDSAERARKIDELVAVFARYGGR